MQCMSIYRQNNTTQPKSFTKNLKNPKNFQKPQNLGLRTLTRGLRLDLGRNRSGWGDLSERWRFGAREKSFCRERKRKDEIWYRALALNIKRNSMDRNIYRDLLSTKSQQKWICRGVVKDLSTAKLTSMDWESKEKLSSRQNDLKFGSMDRRSCRASIEEKPRNLDGSRICRDLSRKEKEGSIEREIVEDLSSLKKRS